MDKCDLGFGGCPCVQFNYIAMRLCQTHQQGMEKANWGGGFSFSSLCPHSAQNKLVKMQQSLMLDVTLYTPQFDWFACLLPLVDSLNVTVYIGQYKKTQICMPFGCDLLQQYIPTVWTLCVFPFSFWYSLGHPGNEIGIAAPSLIN